jgi:hypothetical protein
MRETNLVSSSFHIAIYVHYFEFRYETKIGTNNELLRTKLVLTRGQKELPAIGKPNQGPHPVNENCSLLIIGICYGTFALISPLR